ncbi:GNAT superfamily N-acetyltransferase [Mesorhizobium shonense]|uniref:GNAT superfamily N-acetyltransferase n=1 Tax=Mesorhizobium shonense TaxID=1209948 RepID=A0ABV2I567_9HYPH
MKTERLDHQSRIRRATAEEAPALIALALRSKASNGYDEAFLRACEAIYVLNYTAQTIANGETWVAETADGWLHGFFDLRRSDDGAEVWAMFVEPELKRSGVGRALWRQLETCARSMGAERISLLADPFAVPFYAAMGMEVVGTEPADAISGLFVPRMTKSLAITR